MPWFLLLVSGLMEVAWASLLPATRGFTRLGPTLLLLAFLAVSMTLLSMAARSIPIGTAYAVWVGIGALGAAIVGIVVHGDPASAPRVLFLALLVLAVVGLRVTGGAEQS